MMKFTKKTVALMLISGFVSVSAHARVGRQDGEGQASVPCEKIVKEIQSKMKERAAVESPAPSGGPEPLNLDGGATDAT
jgi:hypothetical protein